MAKKSEEQVVNVDLSTIKQELTDYVNVEIKKSFTDEVERVNKRLIKEKNKQLFFRNIIILILTALVIFLLYLLNSVNFFNKYFNDNGADNNAVIKETNNDKDDEEVVTEDDEPSLEDLISEYGSLLDVIDINESSTYITEFYSGKLTDELKMYIALNSIEMDSLIKEDDYYIIDDEDMKNAYEKIFEDEYSAKSFDYNGVKVRYVVKMESYITDSIYTRNDTNIVREISNVEVKKNKIIITTVEGLVKDNKIYNILDNKEICDYKKNNLLKNSDKLNTIVYTFEDDKLIEISNK